MGMAYHLWNHSDYIYKKSQRKSLESWKCLHCITTENLISIFPCLGDLKVDHVTYPHTLGMVKLWNQTHSVMVYNVLYYWCCFLYFVCFTLHMFHMFFSACIHALYCVIANLYNTISMFIYTQQLPSVTISCQLLIARYVFSFSVDDIQSHTGNG